MKFKVGDVVKVYWYGQSWKGLGSITKVYDNNGGYSVLMADTGIAGAFAEENLELYSIYKNKQLLKEAMGINEIS